MKILVTGGSASGKSAFAEEFVASLPSPHYYLATMRPYGESGRERVARHLNQRKGRDFITIERYEGLSDLVLPEEGGTVLLEDLGNLVTNEMFDPETWALRDPLPAVLAGVETLARQCDELVVVGNEVGCELPVDYSETTVDYVRAVGEISCRIASWADVVIECSAGVPRVIKGDLPMRTASIGAQSEPKGGEE